MRIAFSAYTDHYTGNIRTGHIIKCHMVLLNDGNYYNASTGIFTPPEASSVYLFTFSIAAWHKDSKINAQILKNNKILAHATAAVTTYHHFVMGGNTVITRVEPGETVWLERHTSLRSYMDTAPLYRWATISGVKLY